MLKFVVNIMHTIIFYIVPRKKMNKKMHVNNIGTHVYFNMNITFYIIQTIQRHDELQLD